MILKLAWRNIWRSKLRTFTVMGAIIVGVVALVFYMGFMKGFVRTYVSNAIQNELSHLQIHNPAYPEDQEVQYYLSEVASLTQKIKQQPNVVAYTERTLVEAIALSARGSRGLQLRGIVPEQEAAVTKLDKKITEGVYLSESKYKNPVLISERLAEILQLKVKSKLVVQFQTVEGDIKLQTYKIAGLYKTSNKQFDEQNIFVPQSKIALSLTGQPIVHEIAILLKDAGQLEETKTALQNTISDSSRYLAETYLEVSPDVALYETQMTASSSLVISIVMIALIFGIINTMLMAVLERTKEFGMLLAVGMKRKQVFLMIITEAIMMALVATPLAMLVGAALLGYLGSVGMQMTALEQVGISEPIYPTIDWLSFLIIGVSVAFTTFFAALYPARKATKLQPVEALNTL